jgi:hypothetical protein
MKTEKLLAHIRKNGAVFVYLYVPRHPKTNDYTAEGIIKKSAK